MTTSLPGIELFERFADHLLSTTSSSLKRPSINLSHQYPELHKFLSPSPPAAVIAPALIADFANSKYGDLARARRVRETLEVSGYYDHNPDFEIFRKIFPDYEIRVLGVYAFTHQKLEELKTAVETAMMNYLDLCAWVPEDAVAAVIAFMELDERRFVMVGSYVVARKFIYGVEDGKITEVPEKLASLKTLEVVEEENVDEDKLRETHRRLRHAVEALRALKAEMRKYISGEFRKFVVDVLDYRLHATVDKNVKFVLETAEAVEKAFRLLRVSENSGLRKIYDFSDHPSDESAEVLVALKECLEEAGVVPHGVKQDKVYVKENVSRLRNVLKKSLLKYRETLVSLRIIENTNFRLDVTRDILDACMEHVNFSDSDKIALQ